MTQEATDRVLDDVLSERARQRRKWSGVFNDDDYTPEQWLNLMGRYADKVRHAFGIEDQRKRLVQVAALAVAAVEALDRQADIASRHAASAEWLK